MKPLTVQSTNQVTPRKLFYRIQEVSKITGIKPYVLRYWETEFRELSPAKDASEQRRYRPSDIEVVFAIRKLLYEDRFTIEGARKRLREELRRMRGQGDSPKVEAVAAMVAKPATVSGGTISARKLNESLERLRGEVSELLQMLSA